MTKKKKTDVTLKPLKQPLPAWAYVWISLAGFLLGIGLLFLYIFKAPDLVQQGIEKSVFYVLLLPLGLAAAAFLFGAMRAYARYTGKVLSGKLEIIGPAVVFFLVPMKTAGLPWRFQRKNRKKTNWFRFKKRGIGHTMIMLHRAIRQSWLSF